MIPCVVLGDSIAVGVGHNRPECDTTARVGITSAAYIQDLLPIAEVSAQTAIISLGVNDDPSAATLQNLRTVRATLRARQVFWIVPYTRDYAREAVAQVAQEFGDRTLDLRDYGGMMAHDRIHPTGAGYQTIAARLGGGSDVQVATQFQVQPAEIPAAPEDSWRTAAVQTAYARTRVTHDSVREGWMREPWARRAVARQELAREAWTHTVSHHGVLPVVHHPSGVAVAHAMPLVGRIEFGRMTIYRTFHDWKVAHKG